MAGYVNAVPAFVCFELPAREASSFCDFLKLTSCDFTRGGGGTSILKVTGTCRWTGYDFAVINISTGYLVALFRSSY